MRFFKSVALTLTTAIAVVKSAMIYSCTQPNTIALTFDDGPSDYTEELLKTLSGTDIHVTFFINGNNWLGDLTTNPAAQKIIAKAAADGHQIASHTWAHKVPATNEERKADMDKLGALVEANAGYRPTYFRAPLGECDDACIAYYESIGYKVIQWDTDTNDWNYLKFMKNPQSKDKNDLAAARTATVKHVKNFLTQEWSQRKSNYLVLMHDVQIHTVKQIVPWIVQNKPAGYKFVTVAECLGDTTFGNGSGAAATGKKSASGKKAAAAAGTTAAGATGATGAAGATGANAIGSAAPTLQSNIVSGNTTVSNLQNSQSSGAVAVTSNLYIVATLFAYSLYMLF